MRIHRRFDYSFETNNQVTCQAIFHDLLQELELFEWKKVQYRDISFVLVVACRHYCHRVVVEDFGLLSLQFDANLELAKK